MRNWILLGLCLVLTIFIGCLGMGGGGSASIGGPSTGIPSNAAISGNAFYSQTSKYGGIPILAKDASGIVFGSTITDALGNYAFKELAPGFYNLYATAGDSEVQFAAGVQVIPGSPIAVPEKALVELKDVELSNITSTSVKLSFSSSSPCTSQVEYNTSVGSGQFITVSSSFAEDHSITISGLIPTTRYSFVIKMQAQDGQAFTYSALYTKTLSAIGPSNLAMSIEDGDLISRFTSVRIYLNADGASEMRLGTKEDLSGVTWEGYSPIRDYTLPTGDGTKRIYAQFRDAFGNESSVINDAIQLQTQITGHIGVWINNGLPLTNDSSVVLTLLYPGATHMQVSERSDFLSTFWETYAESRKFKFDAEDGTKVVYVKFKGGSADENKVFSASVELDTTGPEVIMKINNGATVTNDPNVTLSFTPVQTPSKMQFDEAGTFKDSSWTAYASEYKFLFSKIEGEKTVYAKFADELGNIFGPISAKIELDTTPPTDADFKIDDGADTTKQLKVRLTIEATDADKIIISNNEEFSGAITESYKTIKSWVLGGYGIQTVYMKFIDNASNSSSPVIQSIEVLGTPAASGSVNINQNDPSTESATATLYIFSESATKIRVSQNENFSAVPDQTYTPNMSGDIMRIDNYALNPVLGTKQVFVRFEDASGSFSIASDSIEMTGPSSYSISILETQPVSTYTVNLRPFANGAAEMLLTESFADLNNPTSWLPFAYSYNFELTPVNGKHTVYAKFRNAGHVETTAISLDILVSELVPASPTILINAGDSITKRANVQLKVVTTNDYPIVRFSNDGNFFTAPDSASVDQPWFIANKDGEQTVYARFQHKDTGAFSFASDTITAVGPASPTISTSDSTPLNKNFVNLKLYAKDAVDMIITEDPAIADMTTGWIPYQDHLSFPLTNEVGNHTIYAKFRNAATNWIESNPVTLSVAVNSTSPSGNSASFRISADPTSTVATEVPVGSLPIFIHFDIQDQLTATASWQLASGGAPLPTVFKHTKVPAAPILLSAGDFPGNGTFNLYYKFADGVGNETSLVVTSVKIKGPSLKISPAVIAPLKSGQTQQFASTLENAEGTIVWSLEPALPATTYGSIDNTGLYTAPNPVTLATETVIKAALFGDPNVNDQVEIAVETQVEIVVAEKNHQISLNLSKEIPVLFRNSAVGGVVGIGAADGGAATISVPVAGIPVTDRIATITYTAPAGVPVTNPVAVSLTSAQDPTKKEILYFTINTGPWISVTPTSAVSRIRTGQSVFAATTSSSTAVVTWSLPKGGFFNFAKTITTTTTTAPHSVTVFAPDAFVTENPIQLLASFTEAAFDYVATAAITLQSPVTLALSPKTEVIDLGNIAGILLQSNVENATTTNVVWQFKNSSQTAWTNIDSPAGSPNTGELRSSGNDATYFPPATFPAGLAKSVNVRAYSLDDANASDVATISLIAPLEVIIHEGYSATSPISSTAITLEVGTRQFFAEIRNATFGTNLTSAWYVEGVAGGNSSYGTVDDTGKYTAPDTAAQTKVTLRAVSNANKSKYDEVDIELQNFWAPRSENLNDVTNATDSIYCVLIDPTTAAADDRILYCGTNGNGVYRATVNPSSDWASISWSGVTGLSTDIIGATARYTINDLTISLQNPDRIVAATNGGLFLITAAGTSVTQITVPNSRPAATGTGALTNDYSTIFTKVFSGAKIDPTNDNYLYAIGRDQGVLRFIWSGANYVYDGTLYDDNQFYNVYSSYVDRVNFNTNVATPTEPIWTTVNFTRPLPASDNSSRRASGTMEFNCIEMDAQNPNVIYVGYTNHIVSRNPDVFEHGYIKLKNVRTAEYLSISNKKFDVTGNPPEQYHAPTSDPVPPNPETVNDWHYIGASGIRMIDNDNGIIHSIAIDPNTPTTIWKVKNDGVFRSTDDGNNFSSLANYVNVRDIFIDPINTINVYVGTEDGLYRTKDAGATWKRIKTGLEGHSTINALGLTPGGLGTRRIFSGTTNGVFMGRTSLDLE